MDKFVDTVLQPVYNNIKQCSDKYAFFINGMYFTYEQLGRAILLLRSVIGNIKDDNVALVVNDDIETYASIIALWSEGKSYVPLHPNQPINRCQEIMKQVGCSIVLDSSEHSRYDSCINTSNLDYSECPKLDSINEYNENRLSYILFTSGSTGKPKGVMLSRKNLYAFVDSFKKTGINLTSSDRCLQCFDLTFDVAVESFIIPLIAGACIYTIPYNQIKWSYVYGLLEDFKITFGAMAPSMLRYLKPYFDEMHFPEMRYCILTAEASPLNLIEEWSKHIPNADIFNFYGPTEATIYCTYYKFQRSGENKSLNGLISIGKPFSDISAIIINEKGEPLSEYEKGELCIAGDQLTQGYWNDQDKTQKAFFEYKGVSFYHTGDLCF
jgi:D-alanine--poly(phosphoribitol) ligase subunit 1